jgi:DNA-binding transcriptional LysR family regulator
LRILPQLLRAFLKKNPHTEIRLVTGDDPPLLRDLEAGALDAVFMSLPVYAPALKQDPLWQYEMVLVIAPSASRGTARKLPKLEELQSAPFILYRRLLVVDDAINRLCASLRLTRNVVMESDQPDAIKELVKLGLGIAVLPLWTVGDDVRQGKLRILRPKTRQLHQYGILYRRSGYQPRNLSALIEIAHEWPQWWSLARHVVPFRGVART